jgi:hypothetical protein
MERSKSRRPVPARQIPEKQMKLKTTITAGNNYHAVKITVESFSNAKKLAAYEQRTLHEVAVNDVHDALRGRYNAGDVVIK